jgi:DNA polymerase III epsilon subunit-like protein
MFDGLAIVHDWETTGLTLHPGVPAYRQPRAIEFGGALVDCKTGEVVDELGFLVNPGETIEPIITKITGLTNAELAEAEPFEAHLEKLAAFFGRAGLAVAHNLPFDRQILFGELDRLGRRGHFPWPGRELCTVNTFVDRWGRFPKLTEVYEWTFGEQLAQTHRALDDVRALAGVFARNRLWENV